MKNELIQTEKKLDNGWAVWCVDGRIAITNADQVYEFGKEIVEREQKTVMDMSNVIYISSAGLRVLSRLLKQAIKAGKTFTVAGATGHVKMVLVDSNMATILNLKNSLEDL